MYGYGLFAAIDSVTMVAQFLAVLLFMAVYVFQKTWIRFEEESTTAVGKYTWRLGPALLAVAAFLWVMYS